MFLSDVHGFRGCKGEARHETRVRERRRVILLMLNSFVSVDTSLFFLVSFRS